MYVTIEIDKLKENKIEGEFLPDKKYEIIEETTANGWHSEKKIDTSYYFKILDENGKAVNINKAFTKPFSE